MAGSPAAATLRSARRGIPPPHRRPPPPPPPSPAHRRGRFAFLTSAHSRNRGRPPRAGARVVDNPTGPGSLLGPASQDQEVHLHRNSGQSRSSSHSGLDHDIRVPGALSDTGGTRASLSLNYEPLDSILHKSVLEKYSSRTLAQCNQAAKINGHWAFKMLRRSCSPWKAPGREIPDLANFCRLLKDDHLGCSSEALTS